MASSGFFYKYVPVGQHLAMAAARGLRAVLGMPLYAEDFAAQSAEFRCDLDLGSLRHYGACETTSVDPYTRRRGLGQPIDSGVWYFLAETVATLTETDGRCAFLAPKAAEPPS